MKEKEIRRKQRRCILAAVKERIKKERQGLARVLWYLRANKKPLDF